MNALKTLASLCAVALAAAASTASASAQANCLGDCNNQLVAWQNQCLGRGTHSNAKFNCCHGNANTRWQCCANSCGRDTCPAKQQNCNGL